MNTPPNKPGTATEPDGGPRAEQVGREATWQDRLRAERDDLRIRWFKLSDFIDGGNTANLDVEDRRLLIQQHRAMTDLLAILDRRVARLPT